MFFNRSYIPAILMALLLVLGCSGKSSSPVSPADNQDDLAYLALPGATEAPGHELAGFWKISFDLENQTGIVEPQRFPDGHINVKNLLPTPQLSNITWTYVTRTLSVDVKIVNPYTVSGYDLRAIIFTDDEGHTIMNPDIPNGWNGPDGWTPLFDIPGGNYINPFIAYAKGQPNRLFAGPIAYTEHFHIYFPKGRNYVMYGIDVSTPDVAPPGNCDEPYEIQNITQDVLFNTAGSTSDVSVEVLDWQNNANLVVLQAPNITGQPFTLFAKGTGNTWTATLTNGTGINPGTYKGLISAQSSGATVPLYEYVDIVITAKQLWVYNIEGADELGESTCEPYSVEAIGDSGIIYNWTVDPPAAGYFEDPSADATNFCANPVTTNTEVTLQVVVNSAHGGPITRTKDVTIINRGLGWPVSFGGTQADQGKDIAIDNDGNVYVTGVFHGTVDFDPGPGDWTRMGLGGDEAFLSKFDPSGNFLWATPYSYGNNEKGLGVSVDNNVFVYICGSLNEDGFLCKYNSSNGILVDNRYWDARYAYATFAPAIVLWDENNFSCYIVGNFTGEVDFDPGPGAYKLTSDWSDVFTIKLDSSLNYVGGVRNANGSLNDLVNDAVLDNLGNVFMTGYYGYRYAYDHDTDAYVIKYGPSGNELLNFTWSDATGWNEGKALAFDNDHNIYVTGNFNSTTHFDPKDPIIPNESSKRTTFGANDVFLVKFTSAGEYVWVDTWGGTSDDYGLEVMVLDNNKAWVLGTFQGNNVDFDPHSINVDYASSKGVDYFISCFNLNGDYIKNDSKRIGTTGAEPTIADSVYYGSRLYLTGWFNATDYNFDYCGGAVKKSTIGSEDVYITRWDLYGCLVP